MSDNVLAKNSIFNSVVEFFKKLVTKEEIVYKNEIYSKFKDFISDMDTEDAMYENANLATGFCEDALSITRQKIILADKIKTIEEKIVELDCYLQLSPDEAERLKNLLNGFVSITKERDVLINQLTSFDRGLSSLANLEPEAELAIPTIQDAEKNHKILKRNVAYLSGEKAELEHEKTVLENGLVFIQKFTIIAVAIFCFAIMFIGYAYLIRGVSVFIPSTVLCFLSIAVVALVYLFRKRMRYELKVNILKQKKIVEFLNRKNVVFAYYSKFLNFEYKKYKIRNSQMLKTNLKDYSNYKHITYRIDVIRKVLQETEGEINKFLREKKINYSKFTIEQFAHTINVDDKIEYSRDLVQEKKIMEKNLVEYDKRHELVWAKLEAINDNDVSEDKIVSQLIQIYFDEVSIVLTEFEGVKKEVDKEEEAV